MATNATMTAIPPITAIIIALGVPLVSIGDGDDDFADAVDDAGEEALLVDDTEVGVVVGDAVVNRAFVPVGIEGGREP